MQTTQDVPSGKPRRTKTQSGHHDFDLDAQASGTSRGTAGSTRLRLEFASRNCASIACWICLALCGQRLLAVVPATWYDDAHLRDVHFVDDQYGWAVGDHGIVWHTQNGGEIWRRQTTPVDCQLSTVRFVDRSIGYAAGGKVIPLTHRSEGVLLRTEDGGKTWEATSGLLLPWVTKLYFVTSKQGFAVGQSSALHPSGAWRTRDGGRTWTPLQGVSGQHWTDASFSMDARSGIAGLLLSRSGARAWLTRDRLFSAGEIVRSGVENNVFGSLASRTAGYFGGSRLEITGDGGNTWEQLGAALPEDFVAHSMATQGSECWLAGSPGTRILHSQDMGGTWSAISTPATLPISRLHFRDAEHGWAIGARGMILSTDNGGATWKLQRGGAKRMALVGVFAHENEIPWDLLTQTSAQQAYRVHIVLLAAKDLDPLRCELEKRLEAAAARIGASSQVLTRLPYPRGIDATADDLLAKWRQLDGKAVERLLGRLTRVLRVYRPDVVVTAGTSGQQPATGAHQLLSQLLLNAVEYASDARIHAAQLDPLGLQTWTVSRLMAVRPIAGTPVTLDSMASDLGDSVGELSRQSQRLMNDDLHKPAAAWSLFTIKDNSEPVDVGRHPLSDSAAQYASAQRRARTIKSFDVTGQNSSLRRLLQARKILSTPNIVGSGRKRLEQAERMLGDQPVVLGNVLFDLAQNELAVGNTSEADAIWRYLVKQHPDHPLVDYVLQKLVTHHTSIERAWLEQRNAGSSALDGMVPDVKQATNIQPNFAKLPKPGAVPEIPEPIRLASAELPVSDETTVEQDSTAKSITAVPNPDVPNHEIDNAGSSPLPAIDDALPFRPDLSIGFQLARQIKTHHPELYAEPQLLFPLAAASRIDGQTNAATSFYRRMKSLPAGSPWRTRAIHELIGIVPGTDAQQPDDKTASTQSWTCKRLSERPHLDGQLGDECWRHATIQQLHNPNGLPATQIVLARDDEFLYFAAACPKRSNAKYLPKRRPRPRDADLSKLDRLRLSIDINRDYTSWWTIEIDHRGWTNESLLDDFSWSPKYYVASESNEQTWTIEVAIPLDQLAPNEYQSGDWAIGVQRIVPESFVETWQQPLDETIRPDLQGVIRLE